jgi:hypothetical protein
MFCFGLETKFNTKSSKMICFFLGIETWKKKKGKQANRAT